MFEGRSLPALDAGVSPASPSCAPGRHFTREGDNPYKTVEWESRDAVILGAGGVPVFEQRGIEVPATWSQTAVNIVASKYFRGRLGTPERETSVRQMIGRVVSTIGRWGREGGYFANEEEGQTFEDELAFILLTQRASFNSPVWFNVGSHPKPACSACYILSVDDSMESILGWIQEEGNIFRGGSGAGVNLSNLRGSMEHLSRGGIASGPVSFMRGADASAGAIKSGGTTRRAAKMVVLNVDHPDIEEFVACKAIEEEKARALESIGYDMGLNSPHWNSIQYQNANNSVRVTDEFMRAVEEDGDWDLRARVDGSVVKTAKARALFRQIAEAAWKCADPGIQYDTTINSWHTCPASGRINASNPCFPAGALVHTTKGMIDIGRLFECWTYGDRDIEVYTHRATAGENGSEHRVKGEGVVASQPVRIMDTGTKPIVRLRFANGAELRCTPNHRLWTVTRGYVAAEELLESDELLFCDTTTLPAVETVTNLVSREDDGQEVVYNLTEPLHHSYIVDGFVVANCSEYVHLDNSACNLASINLMRFTNPEGAGAFHVAGFEHTVDVMFLAQEIMVGFASYPTEKITKNAKDFRQLGLGYSNLGALLMSLGMPYDSPQARAYAAVVTALMTGRAYRKSAEVAARLGPFAGFAKNSDPMFSVMRRHAASVDDIGNVESVPIKMRDAAGQSWNDALRLGYEFGYRNAQATVLAPCGTISFMMDCDTTGIEPDFALVKTKRLVGGGEMLRVNGTVSAALSRLGYSEDEQVIIVEHLMSTGSMVGAPGLKPKHYAVFDCAVGERSISALGHLKMLAAVQPSLSGSVSKTVNVPNGVTVEDIENVFMSGWKLGLKAVAVYRDGCKTTQALAAKTKQPEAEPAPEVAIAPATAVRRKLPDERQAITHKFRVADHEGYVTVGLYEDGSPGEIFLVMAKEGSTISGLMDALATSVSIALQYGVPLSALVRKFSHARFEPSGFTGNPRIPMAKSVVDYVFRWLATKFLDAETQRAVGVVAVEPGGGVAADTALPIHTADHRDAPSCGFCGELMVRNGTCYRCPNCGGTSGCS